MFTSFFYLVTHFLFISCFKSGVEALVGNMHRHDDSIFEKRHFRATTLKRIDAFSNVSGF